MGFIIVWDDGDHIFNYGFDPDCEGAVCCFRSEVAFFATRAEARKAIKISTAFARLQIAQGKPANTDFTDDIKNVKIVRIVGKDQK